MGVEYSVPVRDRVQCVDVARCRLAPWGDRGAEVNGKTERELIWVVKQQQRRSAVSESETRTNRRPVSRIFILRATSSYSRCSPPSDRSRFRRSQLSCSARPVGAGDGPGYYRSQDAGTDGTRRSTADDVRLEGGHHDVGLCDASAMLRGVRPSHHSGGCRFDTTA